MPSLRIKRDPQKFKDAAKQRVDKDISTQEFFTKSGEDAVAIMNHAFRSFKVKSLKKGFYAKGSGELYDRFSMLFTFQPRFLKPLVLLQNFQQVAVTVYNDPQQKGVVVAMSSIGAGSTLDRPAFWKFVSKGGENYFKLSQTSVKRVSDVVKMVKRQILVLEEFLEQEYK